MEGLPANGAALMRVRARGASGEGGWSDVLQVHTTTLSRTLTVALTLTLTITLTLTLALTLALPLTLP